MAVISLGGEIHRDKENFEMGTIPIHLTEAGEKDVIFSEIHNPFIAVSVHKEKAIELPDQCELLAYTDACCHSFKVHDKPFWGFQFHPEVDRATVVHRMKFYSDVYTPGPEHLEKVINATQETPDSNNLPKIFIEKVLLS